MDFTKHSEGKQIQASPQTHRVRIIFEQLSVTACSTTERQFQAFVERLSDALLGLSKTSLNPKEASLSFNARNLLKDNRNDFFSLALSKLEQYLKHEIDVIFKPKEKENLSESDLSLISFEEMEKQLLLSSISRAIELQHTDQLTTLSSRLTHLVDSSGFPASSNPFRPRTFISAINDAWCEFSTDNNSHQMVLPLLKPNVFIDFAPVLQALNNSLIQEGVMPNITEAYRIKKSANHNNESTPQNTELSQKLRNMFSSANKIHDNAEIISHNDTLEPKNQALQIHINNQLLEFLNTLQKNIFDQAVINEISQNPQNTSDLVNLKNLVPEKALTAYDQTTINLLTKIFDTVFKDHHIPTDVKALIGLLQVPVLKSALIDNNFFFEENHPARRLIELLTKSSVGRDHSSQKNDPFYQTIQKNIKQVQQNFDQSPTVFSEAITNIEAFINKEENASSEALATAISQVIQQEKIIQANKDAKTELALRVGTGEIIAFVETFLENKWVKVLTLALSIKDEKPHLVTSAIKTMDDLIWSVKPKITMEERKELITKLPTMLSMLNKWLNIAKLHDTERLQFFANLAACHASLVRAPFEMPQQKQVELSIDIPKQTAEQHIQNSANSSQDPNKDEFIDWVHSIERGAWIEFIQPDGASKKFKLSWISPLRTLYIFSSGDKKETFSLSSEQLAQSCKENRVQIILVNGLVSRALSEALENNDVKAK